MAGLHPDSALCHCGEGLRSDAASSRYQLRTGLQDDGWRERIATPSCRMVRNDNGSRYSGKSLKGGVQPERQRFLFAVQLPVIDISMAEICPDSIRIHPPQQPQPLGAPVQPQDFSRQIQLPDIIGRCVAV